MVKLKTEEFKKISKGGKMIKLNTEEFEKLSKGLEIKEKEFAVFGGILRYLIIEKGSEAIKRKIIRSGLYSYTADWWGSYVVYEFTKPKFGYDKIESFYGEDEDNIIFDYQDENSVAVPSLIMIPANVKVKEYLEKENLKYIEKRDYNVFSELQDFFIVDAFSLHKITK